VVTLKACVQRALANANIGNATYTKWFGAALQPNVVTVLTGMHSFLSGAAITYLTIQRRGKNAQNSDYAYVQQDTTRSATSAASGNWFIYLGPRAFGNLNAFATAQAVNNILVLTLAHELSHHFGTNDSNSAYDDEEYDADALALVGVNDDYAAHNADSFGYYVDAS
jgi:Lysine-specific metallo-endopeptidase